MKRVIKMALVLVCSIITVGLYAQEIQIVRVNGKGNINAISKDSLKVYTRDAATGERTPVQVEVIDVDESKLLYATAQEAYTATQKGGKATLVYIARGKNDKLKGSNYLLSDEQEVRDIRRGKMRSNDIYVLSHTKSAAKTAAYVYAISVGCKDIKVYIVTGGVEAWKRL